MSCFSFSSFKFNILKVHYIDYGNTEIITDKSSLCQLPDKLKGLAPFAKESSLFGLEPNGEEWSDEAKTIFKEMVEEK